MQLLRLGPVGHEIPAVVGDDGIVRDLSGLTTDLDGPFLAGGGIDRVRAALAHLPVLDGAETMRRGAPVARPTAVICIGQNYAAHAAESGAQPPSVPIVFLKHPNTIVGPDDDVPLPPGARKLDYEVELAVVIGRHASYLDSPTDAHSHIAGYTVVDDLSERAWQMEESLGQWSKGKCGPGFAPLGPALVPTDEVDATRLGLRSWVNGEPRQDSSTSDMIFAVDHLVWSLSQYMALEPGDVICTGTPEGVAFSGRFEYLRAGDVVELEIDGLGRQRHEVVA